MHHRRMALSYAAILGRPVTDICGCKTVKGAVEHVGLSSGVLVSIEDSTARFEDSCLEYIQQSGWPDDPPAELPAAHD